jgi:hypothetical protein
MIARAARLFHIDAARFLRTARCESSLNPRAVGGGGRYLGVFQQHRTYWPVRARQAGMAGRPAFDAWANAYVSAWMVRYGGGWKHWPSCA